MSDPSGLCPECEDAYDDPYGGQQYTSSGGATYEFDEIAGAWNRIDLMFELETVTVGGKPYDQREEFDRDGYGYEIADTASDFIPIVGGLKRFIVAR